MFTAANGDRPNLYNPNTVVLLTDGFTSGTPMQPDNVDRMIVVGLGAGVSANLSDLASTPDDYMQVNTSCGLLQFLRQKLLCQEFMMFNASSPMCIEFNNGTMTNGTAANFTIDFTSF